MHTSFWYSMHTHMQKHMNRSSKKWKRCDFSHRAYFLLWIRVPDSLFPQSKSDCGNKGHCGNHLTGEITNPPQNPLLKSCTDVGYCTIIECFTGMILIARFPLVENDRNFHTMADFRYTFSLHIFVTHFRPTFSLPINRLRAYFNVVE